MDNGTKRLGYFGAVFFGILLCFLFKPVHIDDTVFLQIAQFLTEHPLQPFSAEINWQGTSRSVFYEDNPFFLSYYFAFILKSFGKSEWILHLSCIPFPFLALFSLYGIARRTDCPPWIACGLLISCPAFLVSSTTLMGDVPLIAFYLFACYSYLRFCETPSSLWGWVLAAAVVLATFTKYIGLSLIPLLLVDSRQRRFVRAAFPYLAIPILCFLLWCVQNLVSFGAVHVLEAGKSMNFSAGQILLKVVESVSFAGLSVLAFSIFGICDRTKDALYLLLLIAASILAVYFSHWVLHGQNIILMAIAISGTLWTLRKVIQFQRKDLLLLLWFAGMLVYSWISEFIAARVVLLFAPPLLLFLSRKLPQKMALVCIGMNFVLSFAIASADTTFATVYRVFAKDAMMERTHYIAHWGLQYYLQQRGFAPFDYQKDHLVSGDLLLVPRVAATSEFPIPQEGRFLNSIIRLERTVPLYSQTGFFILNREKEAGFYAAAWGNIPFSFGSGPVEQMDYYRVLSTREEQNPK